VRLTIFGATGATGQLLTQQALSRGHEVIAYARNPARLTLTNPRLAIVRGELGDPTAIGAAIQGSDAVISVLGPKGASRGQPIARGMQYIVQAMQQHDVRRLIATATASARAPEDRFDLRFALAVLAVRLFIPSAYRDIVKTAEVVRSSDLQWTIVRLPILNSKPKQGRVRVGYLGEGNVRLGLARADLAEFLLDQLAGDTYWYKAPAISN
jgi:putative NADH-flavin reductase